MISTMIIDTKNISLFDPHVHILLSIFVFCVELIIWCNMDKPLAIDDKVKSTLGTLLVAPTPICFE